MDIHNVINFNNNHTSTCIQLYLNTKTYNNLVIRFILYISDFPKPPARACYEVANLPMVGSHVFPLKITIKSIF